VVSEAEIAREGAFVKPIIGLTSYRTRGQMTIYDTELACLPANYLESVSRSGGIGLLLPPQPHDSADVEKIVSRLDGLVLTGGADIDPSRFGAELSDKHEGFDVGRDAWELAILEAALKRDLPVFGICRGAQLMNVFFGGTLHQHLPDVVGHDRYRKPGQSFTHEPMSVAPGSTLASIVGVAGDTPGAVQHHQAIDRVGEGLNVVARGFDGVVQGIEHPGFSWCVAVQWHPEENPADDRIIEAFVSRCGGTQA
jgi:putative glutamine amidotransferase